MTGDDEDAALFQRVAAGDKGAFATLFDRLGVDPRTMIQDPQGRPYALVEGTPLHALL